MGLREPFGAVEPTHTVVTRTSSVSTSEHTGWIDVENAVVEVAVRYGTAAHFRINTTELSEYDPKAAAIVHEQFEPVGENECVLDREKYPEFRAILPDDADAVKNCLAVRNGETWLGRLYGVYEFAIVRDETWLYHSIPHESYLQDLNAESAYGFLEAATAIVDSKPKFGVFPAGPLVSWKANGRRYELDPGSKSLGFGDMQGSNWSGFSFDGLTAVYPDAERLELICRWGDSSGTESLVLRGFGWVFDRFTTDPPDRIDIPDRETLDDVLEALRMIARKLDYDFIVHE